MKNIILLIFTLSFLANSQSFARPPECDPGPHGCDNKLVESSLVEISPFTISDTNGKFRLAVDEKGKISENGKAIGLIDSKGTVVDMHEKLLAKFSDNTVLEDAKGVPLVRIDIDGTFDNESGIPFRWLKDGTLAQGDKLLDVKLSPSDSPSRRAASIVFYLSMSITEITTTEVPTSTLKTIDVVNSGKPIGACYISSGAGNNCSPGMTQAGCYRAASNVGGVADWREGKSCDS